MMKWDEPGYLLLGNSLLHGHGFRTWQFPDIQFAPLYPIVTGVLHLFVADYEVCSDIAYVVFGALLCIPVFCISRRIYGDATAFTACIFTSASPALLVGVLYWGTMLEPMYVFLVFAGFACLLAGIQTKRHHKFLVLAGMWFGFAYLTRPEAALYVPLAIAIVFLPVGHGPIASRNKLVGCAGLILAFSIIAAPYILYLHQNTGRWLLTGKGLLAWEESQLIVNGDLEQLRELLGGLDETGEVRWFSNHFRVQHSSLPGMLQHPRAVLTTARTNARIVRHYSLDGGIYSYVIVALIAIGLTATHWSQSHLRNQAMLLAILLPMSAFFVFHIEMRFFAAAIPVLMMWAARGGVEIASKLQIEFARGRGLNTVFQRILSALPVVTVVCISVWSLSTTARQGIQTTDFGYKEAGLWLRGHSPKDAKVMVLELGTALYAQRARVPFPYANYEDVIRYARKYGATYWVVDDRYLAVSGPRFAPVLGGRAPDIELAHTIDEPGEHIRIYRLAHTIDEPGEHIRIYRFIPARDE